MYRELDAIAIRNLLHANTAYAVDTLITYGGHPKEKTQTLFDKTITEQYSTITQEAPLTGFFQDIQSYTLNGTRVWFCVCYGGAMTSELVHIASLLGATKILHGGSAGALDANLSIGTLFLPQSSWADDSCTRMYQRSGELQHTPNTQLTAQLSSYHTLPPETGQMISIQAMLGETREDIVLWSEAGYRAVDLETATVFAVANHFQVPSAALLYIADNLVTEELVHQSTDDHKTRKADARQAVLSTLIRVACD